MACDEEEEMICIVDDHQSELKIHNTQKMVGIALGMPFELEHQFGLFHVSMQIENTSGSKKKKKFSPPGTCDIKGLLWSQVLCSLSFSSK
jgi:hypothetical protein